MFFLLEKVTVDEQTRVQAALANCCSVGCQALREVFPFEDRSGQLIVYGQGSGLDCRHHVQKLNLLQGEAEEAIGWTSRHLEESVNDNKNIAAQHEDSLVQQEERAEVSRWSKYLDKDSEYQEDGEEEAGTERQQFCSQRKNTVEEQRKHRKSFLSSDVQEYAEENGVFQLAYRAKKRKKCLVAVPDEDDGDAVSGDSMVPAVCESVVPEENTQTPTACTKPSKWEKFLSCSDSYSKNAATVTLSPQEGSGRLGLHSTTAPDTTVPSTSCSVEEDVLFKEPQSQLIRAGSVVLETTAGRCCLNSTRRANTLVNSNTGPKPRSLSCEHLFCTGEEFDDDL
ncbi:PREDICTED: UPF0544 protein C5orf45 homolog [Pygoscelis adeliae]|uniref:UPF0544 protein C5orf45 homolog n=1 Tax=Pygoscelis adeliae TaxID=9238 RepID=UPI0004F508C7|nr:PREDICTED: UPF0544 protein C5orf45 homolog [Pygoscelis adeliae]